MVGGRDVDEVVVVKEDVNKVVAAFVDVVIQKRTGLRLEAEEAREDSKFAGSLVEVVELVGPVKFQNNKGVLGDKGEISNLAGSDVEAV